MSLNISGSANVKNLVAVRHLSYLPSTMAPLTDTNIPVSVGVTDMI